MSTRVVTATIRKPDGTAWVGAEIRFALSSLGVNIVAPDLYPGQAVTVVTNAAGQFGLANAGVPLWVNSDGLTLTKYTCKFPPGIEFEFREGQEFDFNLPPGETPIDLWDLVLAGLTTLALDDPLIAVIDARIATLIAAIPTIADATPSVHGLMSAADKTTFDAIPATYATPGSVQSAVDALVGAAPGTLDTLAEIAAQLQSDEGALVTSLALKAPLTPSINAQTGATYSLQASDNGKIVTFSGVCVVTVPSGLGAGFNCLIIALGAGIVSFVASGTTINHRQSHTKIAGAFGVASLVAYAANILVLGGDTST